MRSVLTDSLFTPLNMARALLVFAATVAAFSGSKILAYETPVYDRIASELSTVTEPSPRRPNAAWEEVSALPMFGVFDEAAAEASALDDQRQAESELNRALTMDQTPPADLDRVEDTRLGIVLNGVVHANTVAARAIMTVPGNANQHAYEVGDEIQNGVVVHAIAPRRVVIRNRGNYEAVRLPIETLTASGKSPPRANLENGQRRAASRELAIHDD